MFEHQNDGSPGAGPGEFRFDNRAAKIAAACFGGLICVLGLAGLASGDWTGVAFLAGGVLFVNRALRSATVVLRAAEVELRGFAQTRRMQVKDLSAAEVAVGRTGMNGCGREYLVLHRDF